MTTPKHRALQALADAKGRPFLAAAPLMAIVEAVAVLDEAGLLGRESDATLRSDILAAIDNDEYDDNGEVVEAIRALINAADPIDPDVPIPYRLAEPNMVGATVEPCPDCGAEANEAHSGNCEALPPGPATTDRPLCPKCSEPLFRDGTCMNFPACPNATIPF